MVDKYEKLTLKSHSCGTSQHLNKTNKPWRRRRLAQWRGPRVWTWSPVPCRSPIPRQYKCLQLPPPETRRNPLGSLCILDVMVLFLCEEEHVLLVKQFLYVYRFYRMYWVCGNIAIFKYCCVIIDSSWCLRDY